MARYQPHDRFYRKARERGLPSRAAFKLEELLDRYRLVAPGARIVDLGCAPGGWLAILSRAAAEGGRIVGVDLVECRNAPAGTVTLVADIRDPLTAKAIEAALGGPADLVVSDLSPRLSGIAERDQARARELLESALGFARGSLRAGGAMVAKVFMGGDFGDVTAAFKRHFARVDVTRTRATRPGSSELYVIARDFRPAKRV